MLLRQALRFLSKAGRPEILEFLAARPEARLTINALARATGMPVATAWRAVQDLSDLGLVLLDRQPSAVLVQFNPASPAGRALARLDFPDPHMMAYEAFADRLQALRPGVRLRLFGSVKQGTAKPASDVDVMVIYGGSGHSKREVEDSCARLATEILDEHGIVVSPLIVPRPMVIAT